MVLQGSPTARVYTADGGGSERAAKRSDLINNIVVLLHDSRMY
jgi:hypothetical protein